MSRANEVLEGLRTLGIRNNTKWRWATGRWFNLKTPICMANIVVFSLSLEKTSALEGLSLRLFKFADCKVKITLELAGWQIEAWIGLSKPVEHFHTENVSFWALDLSLIFQMVGRVNWRHGLWMVVLTYKQGWKGASSFFDSTNNANRTYSLNEIALIPPLARWSESQEMLLNATRGWIYNLSESSITP